MFYSTCYNHVSLTSGGDREFSGAKLDMYGIAEETTRLHKGPMRKEWKGSLATYSNHGTDHYASTLSTSLWKSFIVSVPE